MTVKELITELKKLNPSLPVVLQKDEEGNGFEYARWAETAYFIDEEEVVPDPDLLPETEPIENYGYTRIELLNRGTKVLVIAP